MSVLPPLLLTPTAAESMIVPSELKIAAATAGTPVSDRIASSAADSDSASEGSAAGGVGRTVGSLVAAIGAVGVGAGSVGEAAGTSGRNASGLSSDASSKLRTISTITAQNKKRRKSPPRGQARRAAER